MDISVIFPLKYLKFSMHVSDKITHFRNINPLVTCYMSLDGENSRLLFEALLANLLHTVAKVLGDY